MSSAGCEAVELAASAGLVLDEWQRFVLEHSLGETRDGRWAATEVGLEVPRQNGKGSIIEARELAGLFLFGERMQVHTSHEFKTTKEAYLRIKSLIEGTPDLDRRVKQYRQSNEDTSIELLDGARLRFMARSGGSGRGFGGDTVYLDEAMFLTPAMLAALLPTLAARAVSKSPQIWYTGSAGFDESLPQNMVRDRGLAGDPKLAFFEWSAPDDAVTDDPGALAQANPALGIRLSPDFSLVERGAMGEAEYRRERLGIRDRGLAGVVIDGEAWRLRRDPSASMVDPVSFGAAVSLDGRWATIGAGGFDVDGRKVVDVVDAREGTGWVVQRCAELVGAHQSSGVVVDPSGPAGFLVGELVAAGVPVVEVTARQYAQACGLFLDDVIERRLVHLDQPVLNVAVAAATKATVGDAFKWRRKGRTDISPLEAVTLALHGLRVEGDVIADPWFDLS